MISKADFNMGLNLIGIFLFIGLGLYYIFLYDGEETEALTEEKTEAAIVDNKDILPYIGPPLSVYSEKDSVSQAISDSLKRRRARFDSLIKKLGLKELD